VHAAGIGQSLPLWACLPFVGVLLSIAVFPLAAPHFWHRHYPRVAAAWAAVFAVPFLLVYRSAALDEIVHIFVLDYVPFIILLWGLFTVTGGILVRGTPPGTPAVNTALLGIGTALASLIGTTGAAMLLVRPVLRANAGRRHVAHTVVFFIFLVANIGGCLTPLGDPPLFLGFLHHVPFFWTLSLLPQMLFTSGLLLALYFWLERRLARGEARTAGEQPARREPLQFEGLYNLGLLGAILAAVLISGTWRPGEVDVLGMQLGLQGLARDALIVAVGAVSLAITPRRVRRDNGFGWEPIREVALLFAAIFVTIIPALAILRAGTAGPLAGLVRAVREPWQYYWATGGLSSFLDNAPTYLAFFNLQLGQFYPGLPEPEAVARLVREQGQHLEAVAAGAVFMGANTYIGNAPNFMVRSMAEEAGVPMPSFFGYLFRWALPILIPTFLLVTVVFFA